MYKITKILANRKFTSNKPIKGKNGKDIITEDKQLKRWKEFFEELLNKETEMEEEENRNDAVRNQVYQEDPKINTETPTKTEIMEALKEIKYGKSPGVDNITPEMLKTNPGITADILHKLLSDIWEKEEIPKKGDTSICNNWRGITLLSVPSKILTKIILNRIKDTVDSKMRKEQAGFRKGRSCVDMINTLRIVIEQSTEYQAPLHLSFVDFEKAFDSISRESIWKALTVFGIPRKIINLIKIIYRDYRCQVIHNGRLSEPFEVTAGVRQGCLLSPIIFLMVLDGVMRKVTSRPRGLQWGITGRLEDIDFADDLCLLSQRMDDMKEKLEELNEEGKKVGLKINYEKTKEIRLNTRNHQQLVVNGKIIEEVDYFKYLGSVVSKSGGTDEDVTGRIKKAKGAFAQLAPVWRSNQLRRSTKLSIFETNVKSVLLYACQTWKVTKSISRKLQIFINKCLRRIFDIRWPEKITNEELWKRANQGPINDIIKKRKYGWLGHTLRRPDNVSCQALEWNPQGNRRRGRPKITWKRSVEKEISEEGKSWREIKQMAKNRVRWRKFVAALPPQRD